MVFTENTPVCNGVIDAAGNSIKWSQFSWGTHTKCMGIWEI